MTMVPVMRDETIIEVWVNCPDKSAAADIAEAIIGERLAAAANFHPTISSRYHWKGSIESAQEIPLLFKTRQSLFAALARRIAELHPYETPSIIGKEVRHANASYRAWIIEETKERSNDEDHDC
ncbi:MAG: divalent-cation tolerance protein CutA [Geminicoccaceae bacterium]